MYKNWNRYYCLTITPLVKGIQTKSIVIDSLKKDALRFTFEISKSKVSQLNNSRISVYNLSAQDMFFIKDNPCLIVLEAGYSYQGEKNYGTLLRGLSSSINIVRSTDLLDYELIFTINEILQPRQTISVSKSYQKDTALSLILIDILNNLSCPYILDPEIDVAIKTNLHLSGLSYAMLEDLTKKYNLSLFNNNGIIYIQKKGNRLFLKREFMVSKDTGLLGYPEIHGDTISMRMLLNHKISYLDNINLDNNDLLFSSHQEGFYSSFVNQYKDLQIISLKHKGDTRGQDWLTELLLQK